jgi:5'-nucleotidase
LGGHDHFYFAPKGVTSWENYDVNQECLGSEGDGGEVLVIKSGTDFRDLTAIDLELEDVPTTTGGAVRRKLIKSIKGTSFEKLP